MLTLKFLKRCLENRPSIDGRDEYFFSSVLVPLVEIEGKLNLVFQERSENIRQGGEISFPGGEFDPSRDTSSLDTALRETREELGVRDCDIEILGQTDTVVSPMGAVIDAYVGVIKCSIHDFRLNGNEVERVFAVPLDYFIDADPEIHSVVVRIFSSECDPVSGKEKVYLPVNELGISERYGKCWGSFKPKVYFFKHEEGLIWGITARIIINLIKKMGY